MIHVRAGDNHAFDRFFRRQLSQHIATLAGLTLQIDLRADFHAGDRNRRHGFPSVDGVLQFLQGLAAVFQNAVRGVVGDAMAATLLPAIAASKVSATNSSFTFVFGPVTTMIPRAPLSRAIIAL